MRAQRPGRGSAWMLALGSLPLAWVVMLQIVAGNPLNRVAELTPLAVVGDCSGL